jgi:GxxExxY protein
MTSVIKMKGVRSKIVYPELSYKITGILFKIHSELGRFCREKQYQEVFEVKLKKFEIPYEREKELSISENVATNRVDFCIENKVLIDFKAKRFITKDDYYQMQRYLKVAKMRLGLIVNFRDRYLKPKRILN